MVTARLFQERPTGAIHLRRVAVHAAEDLPLQDDGRDRGAAMSVWGREAVGDVVDLEADDGFPGGVWEFVVVEDLGLSARSASGGEVNTCGATCQVQFY